MSGAPPRENEGGARASQPASAPAPAEESEVGAAIAHVRHELRTSLTAIIGYAELLLESAPTSGPDATRRALAELKATGLEIQGLVDEHLDAAKLKGAVDADLASSMQELRTACREMLALIAATCPELIAAAARENSYESVPVLFKIKAAGELLESLLTTYSLDGSRATLAAAPSIPIPPSSAAPLEASPSAAGGPPVRVLIADDNSITRDLLRHHLVNKGYEVDEARGGAEALRMLGEGAYDLLLLDLKMPDLSGVEVLDALRARGQLGVVPVIMISASDDLAGVERCIERGADDYIAKPWSSVLLMARVRAFTTMKRLRERAKPR